MKQCASCKREFKPSSNRKDCPSCRYHKTKTVTCRVCKINKHSTRYGNFIRYTNILKPEYGTGRYYVKKGYIMVFQKGHPRASGSRGNYVFEHILAMKKHLGRYLESDENVHHKNGIKDDNRIENLELWVRPQPSGIRAKEILARYEPVEEKL